MKVISKSLAAEGDWLVDTYRKVFKFDISCENIKLMLTYMIDKEGYYAQRVHSQATSPRSK